MVIFLVIVGILLAITIIWLLSQFYKIGLYVVIIGVVLFLFFKACAPAGEVSSGHWGVKYRISKYNGAQECILYSPTDAGNQIQIESIKEDNSVKMIARFLTTNDYSDIRWSNNGIDFYPLNKKPITADTILNTYKNGGFIYYYADFFDKFPSTNFNRALQEFYKCRQKHMRN